MKRVQHSLQVGIPLCFILTEICDSVFLMITNVQNINPWNLLFLEKNSHSWIGVNAKAVPPQTLKTLYREEQMSQALGINAHHHGSEPSRHWRERRQGYNSPQKIKTLIIYSPFCHLQEFWRFMALFFIAITSIKLQKRHTYCHYMEKSIIKRLQNPSFERKKTT